MGNVDALEDEMGAPGAWVVGAGLHHPSTATVMRLVSVRAQGTLASRRNWRAG
jgi:hypothetical protein